MVVPATLLALGALSSGHAADARYPVPADTAICECSTGHVILGGHDIAGPYVIAIHARLLTINDLHILMPKQRQAAVISAHRARHALRQRVFTEVERSWTSRSEAALTDRARRAFEGSSLVDSVRIHRPLWISVWWKNDRHSELLDLHPMPPPPDSWPRIVADAVSTCRTLEGGGLIVLASSGRAMVPAGRVDTVLREIRRIRNGEVPVTNRGVLSQDIRREIRNPVSLERVGLRRDIAR